MREVVTITFVDKEWYLNTYPDVAAAGVDPVIHFEKHGRFEGRLPCPLPSLPIERDLWANAFSPDNYLKALSVQAKSDDANAVYACNALVAFYLFQTNYDLALKYALKLISNLEIASRLCNETVIFLLAFEAAFKSGDTHTAQQLLRHKRWKKSNAKLLAQQMLAGDSPKLKYLNTIYKKSRLMRVESTLNGVKFDNLKAVTKAFSFSTLFVQGKDSYKVSIVVPLYNAAESIQVTINSLLAQTWRNTEIIIVDDCSTDNSLEVALRYASYPNIKIVTNTENIGAYPTRNRGVKLASGDFITVMDADDWAHPQKIEKQVLPLIEQQLLIGTLSHWVRCNENLEFTRLRVDQSWVYRNVSSLMVRASVFDTVGYWDELKASADTEFYLRLIANYGEASLREVYSDVPLSFGRVHGNSLTQSSKTHLVTQFGGPRQEHLAYARLWHANAPKPLYFDPSAPSFPVPLEMCPTPEKRTSSLQELERWRRAFDNYWYLNAYPNVNNMGLSVYEHFSRYGESEDLSPSPLFVPSAYRYKYALNEQLSPSWHALKSGWEFKEAVYVDGLASHNGKHVAIFSHSVSSELFGAELSFLDVVKACFDCGYKISLFLPNASNKRYVDELLGLVKAIIFLPLHWFTKDKKTEPKIVDYLSSYFEMNGVELVYLNTIMLFEPYIAAKKSAVQTVTHVRELPEQDEHIRELLSETASETRLRLKNWSDYFIANSEFTANWLDSPRKTFVIYNKVSTPENSIPIDIKSPLKVCMLSSNLQKKGVEDFFRIAKQCLESNIEFNLYGPITNDVKIALSQYPSENVKIMGYVDDSYEAIIQNDVVLCLSWFQESFGRTAAEAMINGRVVVGYDSGAIPEVVGDSGILCPFKRTDSLAKCLMALSVAKKDLEGLANKALLKANTMYSEAAYLSRFQKVLKEILK